MEKRTKSWIVGLAGLTITIASVWSFCVFSSNGLTRKFIGNSEYISPIALTSRISRTTTTAIQDDAAASLTESSDQLNWKYYKNEELHFSLSYPESLRPSTTKKERGLVAAFSKFDEQAIDLGGKPNPGYFTQVRIYFWTDIAEPPDGRHRGVHRGERDTPKRVKRSISEWVAGERVPEPGSPDADLTYDALLSLRGWGSEEFERAAPDFLEAARWALFAERGVPMLSEAEDLATTPVDTGLPAKSIAAILAARKTGEDTAKILRPLLFPED